MLEPAPDFYRIRAAPLSGEAVDGAMMWPTALCGDGACVERGILGHGMGINAELLRDRVGAQSCAQLLGDLLPQRWLERGTTDALALRSGSGHASAGSLADLLRLHLGQR